MNPPRPEGGDLPPDRIVKILLVDDQPNNLLALEAVLNHPEYNLVKAHSGEEALRRLLRDDFALILMDVLMPGMDGFETAELIRERERTRYTPIIFVTAIGRSEAHVARGYSAGAVDYLFKPLIPEVLRSKVSVFVELFRKTEEVKQQGEQLRELERREHEAKLAAAHRQLDEERMRQEMRIAQIIQQKLFPTQSPDCPGFEIWGASYPAEETGGDYFDYINSFDCAIDIVVGDVSGHGYGPALIMSATRAYLRALATAHARRADVLAVVNRLLAADNGGDRFVTMLLARLDPGSRSLVYTGAGHPPGYILDHTGAVRATLDSTSPPLGIIEDGEFPPEPPVTLQPGDLVFLYTDGVVETIGPDGSFFGIERALDVIRSTRGESACEIVRAIEEANRQFALPERRHDDFTAIVIKVCQ
jgi:serine phosphatase RsbU (regulator of sigma subunit)